MLNRLYYSLRGICLIDFFVSMHPMNIHQPVETFVITKRASVQRIDVTMPPSHFDCIVGTPEIL